MYTLLYGNRLPYNIFCLSVKMCVYSWWLILTHFHVYGFSVSLSASLIHFDALLQLETLCICDSYSSAIVNGLTCIPKNSDAPVLSSLL